MVKQDEVRTTEAYSLREASVRLGISERHLRNLVARGEVRAVSLGRRRLISRRELLRVLGDG